MSLDRRAFLTAAASATAAFGATQLFSVASAAAAEPTHSGLVRLLIESDRDRLIEQLVTAIRAGLRYPTLLGALAEASAREVRPYPQVGYKYHAFMVLHAVHRSTLLGRAEDRWLPVPVVRGCLQGIPGDREATRHLVAEPAARAPGSVRPRRPNGPSR